MISKVHSIDKLFETAKNFDTVITNDAPLATALNRRLERANIGPFAITPEQLSYKYAPFLFNEPLKNKVKLAQSLFLKSDLSLKEVVYFLEKLITYIKETGSLKGFELRYPKAANFKKNFEEEPFYLNALQQLNTSKVLSVNSKKIAVVAQELFNQVDKKAIEKNTFTKLSYESDEVSYWPQSFYRFASNHDLVNSICDMVHCDNADSIAIVLNTSSNLLTLLRNKLLALGIAINEKVDANLNNTLRTYISLLKIILNEKNHKVEDLIPILPLWQITNEITISKRDNNFSSLPPELKSLYDDLKKMKSQSFSQILKERISKKSFLEKKAILEFLQDLNLDEEIVSQELLDGLIFFINKFPNEIDFNHTGVLFVDAHNSSFIDRDIIIYAGIDSSWVKNISSEEFINSEEAIKVREKKFKILIQQGKQQFFFINALVGSEKSTPPFFFNLFSNSKIVDYDSTVFTVHDIAFEQTQEKQETNANYKLKNASPLVSISATSLKKFHTCPLSYYYAKLLPSKEAAHFIKGNYLHEFAEAVFQYPDIVSADYYNEFCEMVLENLKDFSSPASLAILKSEIFYAFDAIFTFIDNVISTENIETKFITYENTRKKPNVNTFLKIIEKSIHKPNTEYHFAETSLKLNGNIDLIVNNNLVIDYKSGQTLINATDIIQTSLFLQKHKKFDFQALVYLSMLNHLEAEQPKTFIYYFPLIGMASKLLNIREELNYTKVNYRPVYFKEFILGVEFKSILLSILPQDAIRLFNSLDSLEFFKTVSLFSEEFASIDDLIANLSEPFYLFCIKNSILNDIKLAASDNLLKKILKFRIGKGKGSTSLKEAWIFKEDLENFAIFINQTIEDLNLQIENGFHALPINENKTCEHCEFRSVCIEKE